MSTKARLRRFSAWLAVNRRPSGNLKKKEYHIKEKQCCISNKLIIKIMIIVVFIGLFFQQLGCLPKAIEHGEIKIVFVLIYS